MFFTLTLVDNEPVLSGDVAKSVGHAAELLTLQLAVGEGGDACIEFFDEPSLVIAPGIRFRSSSYLNPLVIEKVGGAAVWEALFDAMAVKDIREKIKAFGMTKDLAREFLEGEEFGGFLDDYISDDDDEENDEDEDDFSVSEVWMQANALYLWWKVFFERAYDTVNDPEMKRNCMAKSRKKFLFPNFATALQRHLIHHRKNFGNSIFGQDKFWEDDCWEEGYSAGDQNLFGYYLIEFCLADGTKTLLRFVDIFGEVWISLLRWWVQSNARKGFVDTPSDDVNVTAMAEELSKNATRADVLEIAGTSEDGLKLMLTVAENLRPFSDDNDNRRPRQCDWGWNFLEHVPGDHKNRNMLRSDDVVYCL